MRTRMCGSEKLYLLERYSSISRIRGDVAVCLFTHLGEDEAIVALLLRKKKVE